MPFSSIEEGIASVLAQQHDALRAEATPVYIPLLGKHFASDEAEAFDLETSVKQFMDVSNQRRVLVLYGDAGSGKSSFFQTLTLDLLAEYTPESPVPLFISLPTLKDPVHRAIEETLENHGFSEEQIEALKERYSFVFIFDGYDEIHQLQNLYMSNRLNTWQAKTLISCRSQYVYNKGNPDIYFMPLLGERGQPHLLSALYTAAFNETQISTYFALMRERSVVIPSDEELQIIPGLKSLITTPFLLHMTVGVLPAILARYSAASSSDEDRRLKQMELYDAFITQWFLRQEEKLKLSGHITDDTPDKKPTFWRYAQALAVEMHKHEVTWVSPSDERFAVFFESDAETEMLRSACPLKKSGELFGFWHQSLGTYFTVRTMYEEECAHATELTAAEPAVMGAGVGAGSGTSVSSISVPPPIGSIHSRLITDDYAALKLLTDQVDARFKARLFDIIECSKTDERYAIGASNAISALNAARVSFSGMDFTGIRIPGAELSEGIFYETNFSKGDLRKVIFKKAIIEKANFTQAKLDEIVFGEEPVLSTGEDEPIKCICFDSKGDLLVAGTARGHVHIWDFKSGDKKDVLENVEGGLQYWVTSVCFSPDDTLLAWGGGFALIQDDGVIIRYGAVLWIWHIATRAQYHVPHTHLGSVENICFHPAGNLLASSSQDGTVCVFSITSNTLLCKLEGHTEAVYRICFNHDGNFLLSGSIDCTVRVWDMATYQTVHIFEGKVEKVCAVAFSSNGGFFASTGDSNIYVWDFSTRRLLDTFSITNEGLDIIEDMHISPDDYFIVSSTCKGQIHVWNVNEKKLSYKLAEESSDCSSCTAVRFHPQSTSGKYLVTAGTFRGMVKSWEIGKGFQKNIFEGPVHVRSIYSLNYSARTGLLVSGGEDGVIVRNIRDYSIIHKMTAKELRGPVMSVCLHPTENLIAIGTGLGNRLGDDRLWICDIEKNYILYPLEHGSYSKTRSLSFSPDGNLLVSGSWSSGVCLWSVRDHSLIAQLTISSGRCDSLCFHPDGIRLAAGSSDGEICVWDMRDIINIKELYRFKLHTENIAALCFSHNGKLLASGSWDKTVNIHVVLTGALLHKISNHRGPVESLCFSKDGALLVSGSASQLQVWDVIEEKDAGLILGHRDGITSIIFINEKQFFTASLDHTIRFWHLQKNSGKLTVCLKWISHSIGLEIAGVDITRATGLSRKNRKLLAQNAAIDKQVEDHEFSHRMFLEFASRRMNADSSGEEEKSRYHQLPSIPVEMGDPRSRRVTDMVFSHDGLLLAVAIFFVPDDSDTDDETAAFIRNKDMKGPILVFSAKEAGAICLYDTETNELLHILEEGYGVESIDFHPQGPYLVSAGQRGQKGFVSLWNVLLRQKLHTFEGHSKVVKSVSFHPNGAWLASSSEDGSVRVWDIEDAKPVHIFQEERSKFWGIQFNAQGDFLAAINFTEIHVWDTRSFQQTHLFRDPTGDRVICLAFHPNGKWLASGPGNVSRKEKSVRLWDIEKGDIIKQFKGPTSIVRRIAFDAEGKFLAASSYDNSVYLWDIRSQDTIHVFKWGSEVLALRFHLQRGYIAGVGEDNIIRRWGIEPGVVNVGAEAVLSNEVLISSLSIAQEDAVVPNNFSLIMANLLGQLEAIQWVASPRLRGADEEETSAEIQHTQQRISAAHQALGFSGGSTNDGRVAPTALQAQGIFGRRTSEVTSTLAVPLLADDNGSDNAEEEGCCSRCSVM